MSIRDLLASSGSGGIIVDTQTFTASGTWTKPASALPSDIAIIDLWGGGGSGGVYGAAGNTTTGAGGGGGAHNRQIMRVGDLNATEAVTVGTGGAAVSITSATNIDGLAGGYSEFKGHRAYGGGGGGSNNNPTLGGTGGGIYSAGITGVGTNARGGEPQLLGATDTSRTVTMSSATSRWYPGEWGGGNANVSLVEPNYQMIPIHGGAGAALTANTSLRNSVWGGAAGGAYGGTSGTETGGTSQFGGNGGSVAIPASNTSNVNGGAGSPRGGGGAGGKWGSTGTVTSGAGGRGEVVVTIIRGG